MAWITRRVVTRHERSVRVVFVFMRVCAVYVLDVTVKGLETEKRKGHVITPCEWHSFNKEGEFPLPPWRRKALGTRLIMNFLLR